MCLVKLSGTPYIVSPLRGQYRAVVGGCQHANKSIEMTTALEHRIALNL